VIDSSQRIDGPPVARPVDVLFPCLLMRGTWRLSKPGVSCFHPYTPGFLGRGDVLYWLPVGGGDGWRGWLGIHQFVTQSLEM